jgi:hypothetical protein
MQNLQISCCITLKESYDPENDEAAPKDVSPTTSLPTRNICTLSVAVLRSVALFRRRHGPFRNAIPAARWLVQRRHSGGQRSSSERVKRRNISIRNEITEFSAKSKNDCVFASRRTRFDAERGVHYVRFVK